MMVQSEHLGVESLNCGKTWSEDAAGADIRVNGEFAINMVIKGLTARDCAVKYAPPGLATHSGSRWAQASTLETG
ncbi:MAG: hypothetical protein Tsb0019_03040 [Roseibium sp.]